MHFQISTKQTQCSSPPSESAYWVCQFEWALVKSDGEVVVQGPCRFATEKDARSNIAAAKRAFKATQRCKVMSPGA